jgi:hypothetical protein
MASEQAIRNYNITSNKIYQDWVVQNAMIILNSSEYYWL